jgi:hypothetical protein
MSNPKNWYRDAKQFIESIYGENADLFTALLAATSPQVYVSINWNMATRIYHEYMAGKQPLMIGCMSCHRANVLRALAGETLRGDKVLNFYHNLRGDMDAVTIDTWMLRLFKWFERGTKRIPTHRQYERLAKRFALVAKNIGVKPAELQAMLWVKYREQQGYNPVSYLSVGQDERQYTFADLF